MPADLRRRRDGSARTPDERDATVGEDASTTRSNGTVDGSSADRACRRLPGSKPAFLPPEPPTPRPCTKESWPNQPATASHHAVGPTSRTSPSLSGTTRQLPCLRRLVVTAVPCRHCASLTPTR